MPFLIPFFSKEDSIFPFTVSLLSLPPAWLLTRDVWQCTGEGGISRGPNQPTRNLRLEELFQWHQMTNTPSSSPFTHKTVKVWQRCKLLQALEQWFRDPPSKAPRAWGKEHRVEGGMGICLMSKKVVSSFSSSEEWEHNLNLKKICKLGILFITYLFTCTLFQSRWQMPEYKRPTQCNSFSFRIILEQGASDADSDKNFCYTSNIECQGWNVQTQSRSGNVYVTSQNFWISRELQSELQFYHPYEFVLH